MISIRTKLILFMSLLIIFVVFSCSLFFIYFKRQYEEEHRKLGISMVTLVAQDAETKFALNYSQPSFLDEPIKKIQEFDTDEEIGYLRISNSQGVIQEVKAPWLNAQMDEVPIINNFQNCNTPVITYVITSSNELFHDFSAPVFEKQTLSQESFAEQILTEDIVSTKTNNPIIGSIQLGLSTRKLNEKIYRAVLYGIIPVGFVVFAGGICITFFLNRYIVSPLQNLTRITQNIARGDLNNIADILSKDEIGQLSLNFNRMTAALKESYASLNQEISNHKCTSEQLRKLSQAVEQSPTAILITDTKGNIEYVNPKFTQLTGYTPEDAIGQNPRFLKSGETPSEEYKRLWDIIISGGEWRGEFHNKKKNGTLYWEQSFISPIKNSEGTVTHFLSIKEDITERKRIVAHLAYLADNDPLTNLFNRRRFLKELDLMLAQAQRYDINGALLYLDLDNFKYINDTLGHQWGDELLIKFADLLRERMRKSDIIARVGGDEFAIILPYTNANQSQSISKEILELVRNHSLLSNKLKHNDITVSIGIVLFPEHGSDAETLLSYADLALYKSKEEGRNRVCVFSPSFKIKMETRLKWEKRIRNALDNNLFVLHLQPILDIRKKRISGYEALLRMVDEKGDLITPVNFLKTAEDFGLIQEIDRWVVSRAISIITEYQFAHKGIFLSVNLSGKAFKNPELLSFIKQESSLNAVNSSNLVFEITETAFIENIIEAQHFIAVLKEMGFLFALDDFGTGFSSFSYLQHLPIDYLKIDGSFISNLPYKPIEQHMVKAMVELAIGLGKQTIAEFVENEETLRLLHELGVNYAQGFYIGKPGNISEILGNL